MTTSIAKNAIIGADIESGIASFERDGFLGPIKLYEPDEARAMIAEIRASTQNQTNALHANNVNYDRHFDIPELRDHFTHPTIIKYLNGILGPDVLLWRSEYFPKFPGSAGTEWHQVRDYSYANGVPQLTPTDAAWNAYVDITVWTTFTPATIRTGCMRFVRGSHKGHYFDEHLPASIGRDLGYDVAKSKGEFFGYDFSEFKIDPDWIPDDDDIVELEMQPGEAVIFTAACVHGALPNTTERETRFAIAGRYVPTHVQVYPDQDSFAAHGANFDLSRYGTVLVSGADEFGHNRMRDSDNHGVGFRRYGAAARPVKEIWLEHLRLSEIGGDDDFFDLGGHSAIMTHIQVDIAREYGVEIPLDQLFRHPTVAKAQSFVDGLTNGEMSLHSAAATV